MPKLKENSAFLPECIGSEEKKKINQLTQWKQKVIHLNVFVH